MPFAEFIHLRVRSAFSLLQSTVRLEPLIKACRAAGMPAVAVTDDANLFGAMQFCAAAKKAGVQPIVATTLPLVPREAPPRHGGRAPAAERVVLLVKDAQGYGNLLKLLSHAYVDAEPGSEIQVTLEDLARHQAGLILLTGGPDGPVGCALRRGNAKLATAILADLKAAGVPVTRTVLPRVNHITIAAAIARPLTFLGGTRQAMIDFIEKHRRG